MKTEPDENYEEASQKKKLNNPSFVSLPDEIIVNCLARISRSYYPKLSLFYDSHHPSLFTLWIKPSQILTNQLEKKRRSTRNTRLVQIPSSCVSYIPMYYVAVGSEWYGLSQCDTPSSIIWVLNKDSYVWREVSNMTVAREKALACALNGKLYVMGGCTADESTNWGEVFDPKTQTWESLPDPAPKLRFLPIRKIEANQGKIYVTTKMKDFVYDPKKGTWKGSRKPLFAKCVIDNVWYRCDKHTSCSWYDTNRQEWRVVRGLAVMNTYGVAAGMTEIANYGGKLLLLWDTYVHPYNYRNKHIWCALIELKRPGGIQKDEVWGNIEWANKVYTVPSYVFMRSVVNVV
ncbi:Kelch repeat type 1 [Arabidopsis suecica]|uniref:Kelch repeat type 1 n=1 Tax=Arabidopsis suecica TaxID=45249 RepID=A0A8T2BRQ3_ARASU|nr:Kelch repeat type 1 [Arabidopsis suecica]